MLVSSAGSSTNAQDIWSASSPRHECPAWLDDPDDKAVPCLWRHREDVADSDLLEFRNDPLRARDASVVQAVVAVPASAPAAHLHKPRPDVSGVSPDRDGVAPPDLGVGSQLVARQRPHRLIRQRTNWAPRHGVRNEDAQEPQRISNQCHPLGISPPGGTGQRVAHPGCEAALGPDQAEGAQELVDRLAFATRDSATPRTAGKSSTALVVWLGGNRRLRPVRKYPICAQPSYRPDRPTAPEWGVSACRRVVVDSAHELGLDVCAGSGPVARRIGCRPGRLGS